MARFIGVLFLLLMLGHLLGCPKPIRVIHAQQSLPDVETDSTVNQEGLAGATAGSANGMPPDATGTPGDEAAPAEGNPEAMGEAQPGQPEQPEDSGPQPPAATGTPREGAPGTEPVGPQSPAAGPGATPGQGENAGPAAPPQQYGALDPENFMGSEPGDEPWGRPAPKLDRDARSYTGRWKVAVINRQGQARLLEDPDEWVLTLDPDGQFYAKQVKAEQTWRQQGSWELTGVKLLLKGGPGGERSYDVSRELDNIMVLSDASRQTALFLVRIQDGAAPKVQARYDSDFGVLSLRPSGPAHWRGGYGQPEGTLLLAQLGGYLAGTWEQSPSRGFVIFELREGGIAGGWWYEKSSGFDGRWFAVAAK